MTSTTLDLTPFGFTPTESLAYGALTELGPQTGYGLARGLSIARANAYQALRGLVAKGAVTTTSDRPARFRPMQPPTLVALIAAREAGKLDRLDAQLSRVPGAGAPGVVAITGERSLLDLTMRTAARATGLVTCIAPARLLLGLAPAWHKRAIDKAETQLWHLGDAPALPLPVEASGQVEAEMVERYFSAPILLLVAVEATVLATLGASGPAGYWSSDPTLAAAARATAALLTSRPSR
jgi:sugar-specific transcriptional regulator TrmB